MKRTIVIEIIAKFFMTLFLYTGLNKLTEYSIFKEQIATSPILAPVLSVIAVALPVFEIAIAVLLLILHWRLTALNTSLIIMILFTVYVAISSRPPIGEAIYRTFWPEKINLLTIITLVGGTVGGYISFAGAHRLLDAGIKGNDMQKQVTKSAVSGIVVTTFMRYVLFLAALGVVWHGGRLSEGNPAVSVFSQAAGRVGYHFFGMVMWCAAITSVVGASYTSVSFFKTLHPFIERYQRIIVSVFILISTMIFLLLGNLVNLLIMAGAINGLILPIALAMILLAALQKRIVGNYHHPRWMLMAGWLVVAGVTYMGIVTIKNTVKLLTT